MTVLITLTTAGTDSGPFNLYSNVDGYVSAFATGVAKSALLAGYSSAAVPDGTTIIRVDSTGLCTNFVDINVITTTTTTTTTPPTTTTTTTAAVISESYNLSVAEGDICSAPTGAILYSAGVAGPGIILYTDPALTTPQTGFNYVVIGGGGSVYNINSSTGLIGAATGGSC